jgi:methylated-DNA-[protein]-cysteine S-methyltransferase
VRAGEEGASQHFVTAAARFGPFAVAWREDSGRAKVVRVFLPRPETAAQELVSGSHPDASRGSCAEMDAVVRQLIALLDGEAITIDIGVALLDRCSPFQQRVLRAEHAIPRGRVSTYGRIARHLGEPRAARAVGTALATNPFPLIIPCHRTIRADGSLGGYQGGAAMKRTLLEMEGIVVGPSGRVVDVTYHY